jgi:hypothetical protein
MDVKGELGSDSSSYIYLMTTPVMVLQAFIVHRVLLGKLTVAQLAKKFPTLYGT